MQTSNSINGKQVNVPPQMAERLVRGEMTVGEFVGLTPNTLYAIANVGYQMLQSGKLDAALVIYKGLVAASPYDSVFHCHLATVYAAQEQYEEAIQSYTQALTYNRGNVDALAGRGEMYLRQSKILEALNDLKAAVEGDPQAKRPSAVRARAMLLGLKEKVDAQQKAAQK
ncbi:tetratricopeptide repeat protein [Archangium violaceum]|jgi:tetratricopeptide (TPR) repeat protein|uniref:tetratricopeptide repeat protein n=1 Tax=Archangium violaceum TaxID=83451 RepID=UPI00194DE5EB|nr:tetratricopeptide repeat protein [Archangium violaceum]QRN98299.1 tetratricopeptide repeat protein [Archangium violaceum]